MGSSAVSAPYNSTHSNYLDCMIQVTSSLRKRVFGTGVCSVLLTQVAMGIARESGSTGKVKVTPRSILTGKHHRCCAAIRSCWHYWYQVTKCKDPDGADPFYVLAYNMKRYCPCCSLCTHRGAHARTPSCQKDGAFRSSRRRPSKLRTRVFISF